MRGAVQYTAELMPDDVFGRFTGTDAALPCELQLADPPSACNSACCQKVPLSLFESPLVPLWLLCSQAKGPGLLGRLLTVVVFPSPAPHAC